MRFSSLVVATHNPGKAREIAALLSALGVDVTTSAERGFPEPEETGDSFTANAVLKAEDASRRSGLPALADDSGLVVPALGGAPGIYSARWAGETKDFAAAMRRLQTELEAKGTPPEGQSARFVCVLALAIPGQRTQSFEGRIDGALTFPPRGSFGFGYDPVFIPEGHARTFGEMPPEAKHAISHRARAFEALVKYLRAAR